MKTSILKLICSVFSVVLLMSSCLGGDNDSYAEQPNGFAYIKLDNTTFTQYALTMYGSMVSPEIKNLEVNNFYYLSYKILFDNTDGQYYKAENVQNRGIVPFSKWSATKPYEDVSTDQKADSVAVSSLNIDIFSPFNLDFNDNWLFYYNVQLKDGERVMPHFYYDKTNQFDEDGTTDLLAGEKNKVIIDVRFIKIISVPTNETVKNQTFSTAGVLNGLRNVYQPKQWIDSKYANVQIKFRYPSPVTSSQSVKMNYLGQWSDKVNNNTLFMQFTK